MASEDILEPAISKDSIPSSLMQWFNRLPWGERQGHMTSGQVEVPLALPLKEL